MSLSYTNDLCLKFHYPANIIQYQSLDIPAVEIRKPVAIALVIDALY